MEIEMGKCDKCIFEHLLQEYSDYKGEPEGNRPVWHEFWEKEPEQICVYQCDSEGLDNSVCLKHLGVQLTEEGHKKWNL
jgi:hypothetical protein